MPSWTSFIKHFGGLEAHALRELLQVDLIFDADDALLRARRRDLGAAALATGHAACARGRERPDRPRAGLLDARAHRGRRDRARDDAAEWPRRHQPPDQADGVVLGDDARHGLGREARGAGRDRVAARDDAGRQVGVAEALGRRRQRPGRRTSTMAWATAYAASRCTRALRALRGSHDCEAAERAANARGCGCSDARGCGRSTSRDGCRSSCGGDSGARLRVAAARRALATGRGGRRSHFGRCRDCGADAGATPGGTIAGAGGRCAPRPEAPRQRLARLRSCGSERQLRSA